MMWLTILLTALAQDPNPAPPPPAAEATPSQAQLEADLAAALAANQKAAQAAAPAASPTGVPTSQALLNPEMSVILTSSAGLARRGDVAPIFTSAEDAPVDTAAVQEVEVTFAADVDPYFKARLFLIPHLETVEIEEGYLVSTSLPWNLQLKAGIFRSAFGRNNEQHLHTQEFARRPLTTSAFGHHGLVPAGAQLSLLLPLPWYTLLWAEGFALTPRKASSAFGIDQFWELGPSWSLLVGLSGATLADGVEGADGHVHDVVVTELPPRRTLAGADVYVKWRPVNETQTYAWVAFTAEYIASRADEHAAALDVEPHGHGSWQGVGYAQLVAQVARRWRVGARVDVDGVPHLDGGAQGLVGSASLAFLPTEFSRVRFTYQHQQVADQKWRRNDFFFLQLEGTIGAHGAHPF